jgi:hypothetical protein
MSGVQEPKGHYERDDRQHADYAKSAQEKAEGTMGSVHGLF